MKIRNLVFPLLSALTLCLSGCGGGGEEQSLPPKSTTSTSADPSSSVPMDDKIAEIYALYVESGGTLSYEEWVRTVRGAKGDTGSTGIPGKDGSDGRNGSDGQSGATILSGEGAPKKTQGKDGDSYIDISTWDYYVKKSGSWTKVGNLVIPDSRARNRYLVTYYVDGEVFAERYVDDGKFATPPSDPYKDGYEFLGWYDDNLDRWDFAHYPVTKALNLHAEWGAYSSEPWSSEPSSELSSEPSWEPSSEPSSESWSEPSSEPSSEPEPSSETSWEPEPSSETSWEPEPSSETSEVETRTIYFKDTAWWNIYAPSLHVSFSNIDPTVATEFGTQATWISYDSVREFNYFCVEVPVNAAGLMFIRTYYDDDALEWKYGNSRTPFMSLPSEDYDMFVLDGTAWTERATGHWAVYGEEPEEPSSSSHSSSSTPEATVTYEFTDIPSWITNDGCVIFAWAWPAGEEGSWYACTYTGFDLEGHATALEFTCGSAMGGLLLVRCAPGTTQPSWAETDDVPGRVYNQTYDFAVFAGVYSYSAPVTMWKEYNPA